MGGLLRRLLAALCAAAVAASPAGHTIRAIAERHELDVPTHFYDAFAAALALFRRDRVAHAAHVRPPAVSSADRGTMDDLGRALVQPVDQRLVPIEHGGLQHALYALWHVRRLPQPSLDRQLHGRRELFDVASFMLRSGHDLARVRGRLCESFEAACGMLDDFADWMLARSPIRGMATVINVPVVALMVEGIDSPDVRLPLCCFEGFPSRHVCPDSGMFRPCERPAQYTPEDLAFGRARRPGGGPDGSSSFYP